MFLGRPIWLQRCTVGVFRHLLVRVKRTILFLALTCFGATPSVCAMGQTSGLLGRAAIYIASSRLGTCLAKLGDRFIPRITRNNGTPKKIVPIVYTSYTREMIEAYEGDVYVGRIEFSYQTDVEQHKAKNCMINMLAVDAPYRNKGIGKKLLHQAFAIMEQRGAERIAWISAPLELKALTQQQLNAFYTRQGGVNTGGNMFEYRIKSPTKS